jgi:hypothetical protein
LPTLSLLVLLELLDDTELTLLDEVEIGDELEDSEVDDVLDELELKLLDELKLLPLELLE